MKSTVRRIAVLALVGPLLGLASACDSDVVTELETSSTLLTGTSLGPDAATTTITAQPQTTLVGEPVGSYEVVFRGSVDAGEVLHVVIPAGGYTDIDLENFLIDLVESIDTLYAADVFDDPAAATAFLKPEEERTGEEQALIDEHHLVSLVDGNIIRFQGPFQDLGEHVLGS